MAIRLRCLSGTVYRVPVQRDNQSGIRTRCSTGIMRIKISQVIMTASHREYHRSISAFKHHFHHFIMAIIRRYAGFASFGTTETRTSRVRAESILILILILIWF